jgi:RNA polymerase sigma-70 factor (ECF subfamily)
MSVPIEQLGERMIGLLPRLRRLAHAIIETAPAAAPAQQCAADDVVQTCIERALLSDGPWSDGHWSDGHWEDERDFEHGMLSMLTRACTAACQRAALTLDRAVQGTQHPGLASTEANSATLRRTYAGLPPQQRAAIALVVLEQCSYRDAAAMLEMPLAALTQQLWQAREALQAQLQA